MSIKKITILILLSTTSLVFAYSMLNNNYKTSKLSKPSKKIIKTSPKGIKKVKKNNSKIKTVENNIKEENKASYKLRSKIVLKENDAISNTIKTKKDKIFKKNESKNQDNNPIDAFRELDVTSNKRPDNKVSNQRNFPLGFDDNSQIGLLNTEPSETPSESEEEKLPWAFGQARGYSMLYAMHPKARKVSEIQVQNLINARIREPYIAVLIDGTFSKDYNFLKSLIKKLNRNQRILTLALYISNGPTMRKFDSTPIETDFSKIDPFEFREKIKWNSEVRLKYTKLVEEANILFSYNKSLNRKNINIAIPMLEDNLQRDSYFIMKGIVENNVFPNTIIIRNPCKGCYPGNDNDRLDANKEEHEMKFFDTLTQGDGFTFDGHGFNYPHKKFPNATSVKDTEAIMNLSLQRGLRYVGLWQFSWQGLLNTEVTVHPNDRNYIIPTERELEYEIEVLREGLSVED